MAEPRLAVRRKSCPGSVRKRSRAPVQPSAVCSPVARKRLSSAEGPPAETSVRGWRGTGRRIEVEGTLLGRVAWPSGCLSGSALLCMRRDVVWL